MRAWLRTTPGLCPKPRNKLWNISIIVSWTTQLGPNLFIVISASSFWEKLLKEYLDNHWMYWLEKILIEWKYIIQLLTQILPSGIEWLLLNIPVNLFLFVGFRKHLIRGQVHDPTAYLFGGIAGHAGVFSIADDLVKYMQVHLNKGLTKSGKRVYN